ncbi:MFS transporter [Vibrio sp. SCSIO 43135]|uniref:MFS transporter n=1 Tax=Vibrio sp. SCSIO 43135 TaxID=2819096 RepID=UPI002075B589|nr:MFS transporter [Vibrio sp. SCSIO 43135]
MTEIAHPQSMWKNSNYLRLLSAQVISLVGTGMSSVCLALLAYELAGDEAGYVLSIAFALKMLAYIVLAPLFGTVAHKLPKRKTLFALDLIRALMFVCLPFVTEVWEVYVLMFVINACSAGFTPLFQSTLPLVLPDKTQYAKALSLSRMAYDLEQIFSPMLTAMLLSLIGFRQLFMLDAGTFVLSGILILFCALPNWKAADVQAQRMNAPRLGENIKLYLSKPKLKALWFAYLAVASASAMVLVNTVIYVHEVLHGDETQTALAMMMVGFGSMVMAFRLPRWLEYYPPQHFHWMGLVTICGAFALGSLTPGWIGFGVMCVAMGVGMSCIQTSAGLLITKECGEGDSTPYFAAHFSLTHFWWLFTYLAAGISVKVLGLGVGYMLMGLLCLTSCVLYYRVGNMSIKNDEK